MQASNRFTGTRLEQGESVMEPRINYPKAAPGVLNAMLGLSKYLGQTALGAPLIDLVNLRGSQINGCAYCVDMHWKDLRAHGESEQRLYGLDAWEESPYYTERERAALAWTEAVTLIADGHAPDSVYEELKQEFSDEEIVNLTVAINTINGWNRIA